MIREGHETTEFFIGTEVEHTPAYGMRTLFVVGVQPVEKILELVAEQNSNTDTSRHIQHVYFGANMSFPNPPTNDHETWSNWESMIGRCLANGLWCTLDVDVSSTEGLVEGSLVGHFRFIPMISVKLPYLQQLGYNATIKLDDKDFNATNPGVWCHSLHELTKRNMVFTDWSKYTQDEVIKNV